MAERRHMVKGAQHILTHAGVMVKEVLGFVASNVPHITDEANLFLIDEFGPTESWWLWQR